MNNDRSATSSICGLPELTKQRIQHSQRINICGLFLICWSEKQVNKIAVEILMFDTFITFECALQIYVH